MKIVLSVLFLLFLCHFGAFAQCNYELLVKEGRAFFEKEQYRAALKKFNAARTCDPTKSGEVDKEVDRVFDAIESQRDEAQRERRNTERERQNTLTEKERAEAALQLAETERRKVEIEKNKAVLALKLADTMRDSARMAQSSEQRLLSFQESTELMRLGEAKFYEKDYERAVYLYEKAEGLLKNLGQNDSIAAVKIDILEEKRGQVKGVWNKSKLHKGLIAKGDSLVGVGLEHYAEAYEAYLDAKELRYDSAQCIERVNNMEKYMDSDSPSRQAKHSIGFQQLLVVSANENWEQGSIDLSKRRMKSALRYGFKDTRAFKNDGLRAKAIKYNNFLAQRYLIPISIGISIGCIVAITSLSQK
jgi:hypothetical protein